MGGLRSQVIFETWGTDVRVRYRFNIPTALWQIHESPVDFSIDPKLRCRPEHVGHFPLYSGSHMSDIYNVTTGSLVLHSLVLLFEGEPFACGTIVPHSSGFSYSFAFTEFKLGIFGRLYFNQWPSELNYYSAFTLQHPFVLFPQSKFLVYMVTRISYEPP